MAKKQIKTQTDDYGELAAARLRQPGNIKRRHYKHVKPATGGVDKFSYLGEVTEELDKAIDFLIEGHVDRKI
jgi:hypothetical protein